jgi:hypothetical protein
VIVLIDTPKLRIGPEINSEYRNGYARHLHVDGFGRRRFSATGAKRSGPL